MPEHEPGLTKPARPAPINPKAPRRLTYGDEAAESPATVKKPKR